MLGMLDWQSGFRSRRRRSNEIRDGSHDVVYDDGAMNLMKPETLDSRGGHRSHGAEHEYPVGLHQQAEVFENVSRMREALKVDEHEARLQAWPQVPSHHRPRVRGDDVESFFDELRSNQRARTPFAGENHDIRFSHRRPFGAPSARRGRRPWAAAACPAVRN